MKPTIQPNSVLQGTILRRIGKSDLLRKVVGSSVAALFTLGSLVPFAQAGQTWDGGAGTGNWADANNWNPDGLANFAAGIIFANNTQLNTNNNVTAITTGITFDNTAGAFTLGGNAVTNTGNIVNQSASNQIINLNVTLGNSQVWQTTGAGSLTMNNPVIMGANTLTTTAAAGNIIIAGSVGGTGGITHTAGNLALNAANGYTGATAINGGTVILGNAAALGTTAAGTAVAAGATLDLNGQNIGTEALTLNGAGVGAAGALISSAGTGTVGGAVTLGSATTIGGAGNTTITGAVSGAFNVTKVGAGTLTLNNAGNNFGNVVVNGGTVAVLGGNAIADASSVTLTGGTSFNVGASETISSVTGAGTVNLNAGTLTIGAGGASFVLDSTIAGAGNIAYNKVGTVISVSGNNTYAGTTAITSGTVQLQSATALGNAVGNTSVASGAVLDLNGQVIAENLDINGSGTGNGALINGGAAATVNGTVNLSGNSTIGVANNAITLANTISGGASTLTKVGPGTLNFTGGANANTYTGITTVNDGTLGLGKNATVNAIAGNLTIGDNVGAANSAVTQLNAADQIINTSNVIINSDGRFNRNGNNETIASLTLTANGANVNGAGTLTVTGDINMTSGNISGGTTVLGGNIIATGTGGNPGNPATIADILSLNAGNHNITVNAGTALNPNPDLNVTGAINGAGGFTKLGAGTMQTTTANGYAGATVISNGILVIAAGNATPFGVANAATNDTLINNTGTVLLLNGATTGAENITTNTNTGFNNLGAIATVAGGTGTVGGLITLTANSTIQTNGNGAVLNLNGGVSKIDLNLTLTHIGGGTGTINVNAPITGGNFGLGNFNDDLIVNGVTTNLNAANTYLGPTIITSTVSGGGVGAGNGIVNANVANAMPTLNGRTAVRMDAAGTGGSVLNVGVAPFNQSIASLTGIATSSVTLGSNVLTIGFGTGVNVNGDAAAVFAGIISGNTVGNSLIKDDTSTQILTGANTYVGNTVVNNGTLQVGNGVTAGSALGFGIVTVQPPATLAINLANGGTFNQTVQTTGALATVNANNNAASGTQTINGFITGPGTFLQNAGGTSVLANGNNYQGGTTITAASNVTVGNVVSAGLVGTGNVVINNGSTLQLVNVLGGILPNNISGAAGLGSVLQQNSTQTVTLSGAITTAGISVTQNSTGVLILTNAGNNYGGLTSITNTGTLQVGTAALAGSIGAAAVVVNGGGTFSLVNLTGNALANNISNGGLASGGTVLINSVNNNTLNGNITNAGGGLVAVTQSGLGTTILNGAANNYGGVTTINAGNLQLGANGLNGAIGGGNIVINGGNLVLDGAALTYANVISGAGNVIKGVAGSAATITTLTGANTYNGTTTINVGTLVLGNVTALGTTVGGTFVADGATLNLNGLNIGAETVQLGSAGVVGANLINNAGGPASLTGAVVLASNAIINTVTAADDITLSGVVSGNAFSLNKNGAGTLILTGVNTYAGVTNLNAGTIQVGNASALGSAIAGTVVNAGTSLNLNGFNIGLEPLSLAGAGNGDLATVGALQNGSAAPAVAGGPVVLAAATTIGTHAGSITLDGVISDPNGFALTKVGVGTLVHNGVNTYTGATNINQGILIAGNAAALGAIGAGTTVAPGASLLIANGINVNAEPLNINGNGTGAAAPGALTQAAGGSSSFAGPITVQTASNISTNGAGTLTLTGGIIKTNVNLTLNGGGTININTVGISGNNDNAFNDDLIVDAGTTVNLNVANTYEGPTFIRNASTVNANVANALPTVNGRTRIEMDAGVGNLVLGASQAIASLNSVNAASTVNLNANTLTIGFNTAPNTNGTAGANFNGVISGAGNIIKDDTSTQIFSGNNTYAGTTSVTAGILIAGSNNALGSTAGSTTVTAGAALQLANGVAIGAEPLFINGAGTAGAPGALTQVAGASSSFAGLITLQSASTINTNGAGTLTLSGGIDKTDLNLTLNGGGTITINTVGISGDNDNLFNDDLIVDAGTTVNLNVANTYEGPTFIRNGSTVNANVANALPTANGRTRIEMDAGVGNLVLGASQSVASLNSANAGSTVNLGANTLTIGFGSGANTNGTANANFTGVISGVGGSIIKDDISTQIFSGNNTYTGTTNINAGILIAGSANALGSVAGGTTVANGASLLIANGINVGAEPLNINGAGTGGAPGALTQAAGGTSSFAGAITLQSNSTISTNGAGTLTLSGGINKTDLNLTLNGGGTITINTVGISGDNDNLFNDDLIVDAGTTVNLNVANTYEGPTFIRNGSTVNANVANALPTVNGRTRIEMDAGVGNLVLGASQSAASVTSLAGQASTIALGANTLTIGFGLGQDTNGTANANFRGTINGANGNIVKDETSTQIFSGINGYTGTTTINGGTLVVNGTHNNAGAYNIGNGAGAVEVLAGATVNNGGLNGIFLAPAASVNVLNGGSLSVGDPTVALAASVFSISNPGNVAITMANGSTLNVDLFNGAGLGNNQGILGSSDRLNLTGTLASGVNGGVLVIGNPLGLTGFRGGDSWLLVNMATANGAGNITGSIGINANGFNGLNDAALGLTPTQVGNFNQGSGVYTVIDTITGIQMSNIMGQSVMTAAGNMLSDVNGRLFFLRAGYGDRSFNGSLSAALESGEGDKAPSKTPISPTIAPPSDEWQVFVNANYTNVQIDAVGAQQAGFDSDTWTAGVGFERSITPNFTLGFAANWLESYQDFTNNVGQLEMNGIALSAYGSYVKQNFWADLLYSFGSFDIETERNTIGFPIANGETEALTHAVQFNTGYNFRFQDNTLVTGPFFGVDYMHADVDGFSESTGGLAALRYNDRSYDSLISRIGWSVTKKVDTDFAKITAQLRLSYERQNIKYDNQTSVTLINQPFSPNSAQQNLGQDYMVLGAGVNFQFSPRFGMLLNYQGQFFRESVQSHYIGLRGAFSF